MPLLSHFHGETGVHCFLVPGRPCARRQRRGSPGLPACKSGVQLRELIVLTEVRLHLVPHPSPQHFSCGPLVGTGRIPFTLLPVESPGQCSEGSPAFHCLVRSTRVREEQQRANRHCPAVFLRASESVPWARAAWACGRVRVRQVSSCTGIPLASDLDLSGELCKSARVSMS